MFCVFRAGERIFLTLAMLLGASVYAYVVGSICGIIASMNQKETEFQETMDKLNVFIVEARADDAQSRRLGARSC